VALPGWMIRELGAVPTASDGQVQPAGVDLRVAEVEMLAEPGLLGVKSRIIPRGTPVAPEGGVWRLTPGAYRIRFLDVVEVPRDSLGLCFPRSSLLRMGAALHCAVWDPGYKGRGQALLTVYNPNGITVEAGARIAQIIFIKLAGEAKGEYQGAYQGEGLEA